MKKLLFFTFAFSLMINTVFAAWLGFKEQDADKKGIVMVFKDEQLGTNASSSQDLLKMVTYGDAIIVDYGTECYVLERKFSKAKIRITSGENVGYVGWVYIESLRE